MRCELCGKEHDGSYGSGRFCSKHCARSYSTTSKDRQLINSKISQSLQTRYCDIHSQKQQQRKSALEKHEEAIKTLLNEGFKFLQYPEISFNCNYLINTSGVIISCKTLKPMQYAYKDSKYQRVVLTDSFHKKHLLYVHIIVAYNYIPNPNNYPIINHIDENPSNNCVNNLEWCTYLYNNTYNDVHIRRGLASRGNIPWNKGKKLIK